jgi:large subunit ribosomal protein L25
MKLSVFDRSNKTKGEISKIRFSGDIPAVIYGSRIKAHPVFIKGADFLAFLRKVSKDRIGTTVLDLEFNGETHKALIKEVQYHKTSYKTQHVDIVVLAKDKPVKVNVPVEFEGEVDCVGVKLGGFLRKVIRYIAVECPADQIPEAFTVDVTEMNIGDSKKLSEFTMPAGVKPLAKTSEVVVTIAKR